MRMAGRIFGCVMKLRSGRLGETFPMFGLWCSVFDVEQSFWICVEDVCLIICRIGLCQTRSILGMIMALPSQYWYGGSSLNISC